MTPEEKARRQKLSKNARHLAAMGRPMFVLPEEFALGMRILRKAQASGMSLTQIADQLEMSKSTPAKLLQGGTKTMRRETYDLLLKLQPELPERQGDTRRGGSKQDPTTTIRRVQALTAAGWTSVTMAPFIGMDQRNLSSLVLGKVGFVYAVTQREIALAYDKLQHMDPLANGGTKIGSAQARSRARSYGWAPPWCWDEDTIDDPKANPEWTGACGTLDGAKIHRRENIPMCPACTEVIKNGRAAERRSGGRFSAAKFRIAVERSGLTSQQLAERVDVSVDSIHRWAGGSRQPYPHLLDRICAALDVEAADLIDSDGQPVFKDDGFQPGVLREVLTEQKRSILSLASEIGVSHSAVNYWLNGTNRPKIPSIVKAAEILGVDWHIFYEPKDRS
jgi:transcriptional regulator with XRE-family HTH domain